VKRLTAILLCGIWACAGCGASSTGGPSLDFDGWEILPLEDTAGENTPDIATGDATKPDGTTGKDVLDVTDWKEDSDQSSDGDADDFDMETDAEVPFSCKATELFCASGQIAHCNIWGDGYVIVDDCNDFNLCTEDWCFEAECTHEQVNPDCCHPACSIGDVCVQGDCVCAPKCVGKQCGPNGCGGTCGTCADTEECTPGGQCRCIPLCDGKECGDDSCGAVCGTCQQNHSCEEGLCVCHPDCENKECGPDGCGGSCGTCGATYLECQAGQCVFTCAGCPVVSNCTRVLWNLHAYYFCTTERRWSEARDACKDFGGYLVKIDNADENAFLASQITVSHWIGLAQDWGDWGKWKWTNGQQPGYTNWASNQPDNGSIFSAEDCVEMQGGGQWNDNECSAKIPYICELKP